MKTLGAYVAGLVGIQAFWLDAHHLADLVTILGSVWIIAATCGKQLWRIGTAITHVADEFRTMRLELSALGARVSVLESFVKGEK